MYDPARDVWNSNGDSENNEQNIDRADISQSEISSKEKDVTSREGENIGFKPSNQDNSLNSLDHHDDNNNDGVSTSSVDNQEKVEAEKLSSLDHHDNNNNGGVSTNSVDKQENLETGNMETENVETEKLETEQTKSQSTRSTQSSNAETQPTDHASTNDAEKNNGFMTQEKVDKKRSNPSPTVLEPVSKLKRPSSRFSHKEREARNRQMRQRMEDQERNNVESVRNHYNNRPNTSIKERKDSPIIKLRSFNNFIKSVLIERFATPNATVLDIGVGKGGDLQKWAKHEIRGIIGVDVADESLKQAKQRYDSMKKIFWADFCVGNPFKETVEKIVHPDAFPVEVVSIQFTLHYAFESERQVRMLLSNVSRALKPGGRFIGTIPNCDVIMERVAKLGPQEKEFGNSVYKIAFTEEPPKDLHNIFGYEYTFYLKDAVGNVPEYIVPFESFRALAQEYNLQLIYKKPFLQMFDEELYDEPSLSRLCHKMHVIKSDGSLGIEGDQREACGIYLAFAFEKVL